MSRCSNAIDYKLIVLYINYMCTNAQPNLTHSFMYRVAQKVSHYQIIKKIVLNRTKVCQEIRFLRQIKEWSSTIILPVGIKYSLRDLLFDVSNYAWPTKFRYAPHTVNDISAPSGISST